MDDNSSLMARLLMGLAGRAENVMGRPPVPTPLSNVLMNQSIVPRQPSPETRNMIPLTESGRSQMLAEQLGLQTPPQPSSTPIASQDRSVPLWARFLPQSPTPAENLSLAANIIGGPSLRGAMPGIRAFHGSPHKFDRFDMSRIGTGEGAQAYGHGLYFAENEGVARSYRDANIPATAAPRRVLFGQELLPGSPEYHAGTLLETMGRSLPQVKKEVTGWIANARPGEDVAHYRGVLETLNRLSGKRDFSVLPPEGHMYEVNIRANPEQFANWEGALSGQNQPTQAALNPLVDRLLQNKYARMEMLRDPPVGQIMDAVKIARREGPVPGVEQTLREAGIPGIKYLDQGSRAAGQGSSNYVLFDDSIIDILKRYGLAGGIAAPPIAQALMNTGTPQQQ